MRFPMIALALALAAGAPATAQEAKPAPWLVAQEGLPMCEKDGRKVPIGATACREGRVHVCERGRWVDKGQPC